MLCNSQEVEKWHKCVFLGINLEIKITVRWFLHAKFACSLFLETLI